MKIVIDADYLAYLAASVCESRSVICKHAKGSTKEFKNRTEFKKWIADLNLKREEENKSKFELEEFTFEDIQTTDDPKFGFKVIDSKIKSILASCGYNEFTDSFHLYLGAGETFRHKLSTLLEYKGNRANLIKPVYLPQMRAYLQSKHDAEVITDREADDEVNIIGVSDYIEWKRTGDDDYKTIVVSIDKDARAGPMWLFNPDKDNAPRLIEGFGKLWLDAKGKVTGEGRLWGGFQILYGDDVDNYRSTCCTNVKFGPKGAYALLKDCKDDTEMWQAIVLQYKTWYPKPLTVTGWRGNKLKVDWLYILQEVTAMATMLTSVDMQVDIKKILDNQGVKY